MFDDNSLSRRNLTKLSELCNGDEKGVPGSVVCIGRLESEGLLVVWYRR